MVTSSGMWAQSIISNVATLHCRPGQRGGVYSDFTYSESPNFNYIGCKTMPDDVYFDDILLLSDEGKDLEISGSKYLVVQIDKTNQYVNHVELKIETPPPLSTGTNLAAYHSIGIYSDESGLYLYGTVVKTDSLYLNEKLLRSVNKSMGFILQFDESLNLVDEFYFQEKNPNIEVWLKEIYIKDNRLVLFGSFLGRGEAFIQPMDIANESIFPILIGGENLTEFVIALDRKSKKIVRHIPFIQASVGFFSLNDIDEDDDGNIYVATKNNGGKFIVAGKTVPINRHFDYGAVSFSIDTLDKLNFIMNYEGYGVEDVTMIKGSCDENVYEVGYMTYFAPIMHEIYMYMNYDSIRINERNSEFILKRDKSGNLQWFKYSGCNTGYDSWLSMDCSHQDYLVMGGFTWCSEKFEQKGVIRFIDKSTGLQLKEYLLVKDTFVTGFAVHRVKYQADGSFKVLAYLGAQTRVKGPSYFNLAGQSVKLPTDGSLFIFDFRPSLLKTEENKNGGVILFPNPVSVGETVRIDNENAGVEEYKFLDIMGRIVKEVKGPETVVDLVSGMYFLTTSDRKIIGKIVVVR